MCYPTEMPETPADAGLLPCYRLEGGEWQRLRQDARAAAEFVGLIGEADALQDALALAAIYAPTPGHILLTGETGTGKELLARAIHRMDRPAAPFVALAGGELQATSAPSKLFGHIRGAYTGADTARQGAIRQADGGWLFLDELADAEPAAYDMMMRFLDAGTFRPLGSDRELAANVRVVAATGRPLGKIRPDFLARFGRQIHLPPLSERRADVQLLAPAFAAAYAAQADRPPVTIRDDAIHALGARDWPGNIRGLRTAIEALMAMAWAVRRDHITAAHVQADLGRLLGPYFSTATPTATTATTDDAVAIRLAAGGITAAELAHRLNIGTRSAQRRLARLEAAGRLAADDTTNGQRRTYRPAHGVRSHDGGE